MSHEHGIIEGSNKKVALLIAVLALALALSETFGKSAQTIGITHNVEASNLWAFFQAKTIRMTVVQTAAEQADLDQLAASDAKLREALQKRADGWRQTAARYDSEPSTREGRKELMARALEAQHKSELALEKYHHFEIASAAFQIAIVLASATVITGLTMLLWLAGGLGLVGIFFCGVGLFVPRLIHLF